MRAVAVAIVRDALRAGYVSWRDRVPRIRFGRDADTRRAVAPCREAIDAILARAAAYRRQLATAGPAGLRFRDPYWCPPGTCPACGATVGAAEVLRCDLCEAALELAVAAPEGNGVVSPIAGEPR